MKFSEKLRQARLGARLTQEELSGRLGVAKRTLEGYESGSFYPRKREIYDKLSEIFKVDKNWFLTEEEGQDAVTDAARTARKLVNEARTLYAGGSLSQADKDALAKALMDAYFMARERKTETKAGGK